MGKEKYTALSCNTKLDFILTILRRKWGRQTSWTISRIACNIPYICDALRDLVSFVQFKKREKHPWRNVIFSKVAG